MKTQLNPAVDDQTTRSNVKLVEHRQITIQLRHAIYGQLAIGFALLTMFSVGLTKTVDKLAPLVEKPASATTTASTTTTGAPSK